MTRRLLAAAVAVVALEASARAQEIPRDALESAARTLIAVDLDENGESEIVGGFVDAGGNSFLRIAAPPSGGTSTVERTIALPCRADFLAAGDFDADGHVDVVVAESEAPGVRWLRGDGKGNLNAAGVLAPERIVTALAIGDVDRSDGIADIVVAVAGPGGPALLVFESPDGATHADAEVIPLPAKCSGLAVGNFLGDRSVDIGAACGTTMQLVRGRDRKLGMDSLGTSNPAPPEVESVVVGSPVVAVLAGRFARRGDGVLDLLAVHVDGTLTLEGGAGTAPRAVSAPAVEGSVMSAKISADAGDQLFSRVPGRGDWRALSIAAHDEGEIVARAIRESAGMPTGAGAALPIRAADRGLETIWTWPDPREPPRAGRERLASTFTVDTTADTPDAAPGNGVCADAFGFCTLRAAIQESNALAGADTIVFAVGAGTPKISVGSPLPVVDETLSIRGDTGGAARIEIEGSGAGPGAIGLDLGAAGPLSSSGSLIRALVIDRFGGEGILVETASNSIENCYVGTDPAGGGSVPGNADGIVVAGGSASGNVIGGATVAQANVVSNNVGDGIRFDAGAVSNVVAGNRIGTDPSGSAALPNGREGITITGGASSNTVGGATPSPGSPPGNIISGNSNGGIEISAPATSANLIQGNLLGLQADGAAPLGNGGDGIRIHAGASGNTIGGSAAPLRNVVSSNAPASPSADGVEIDGASNNAVRGNFIGLDVLGNTPRGNGGYGVYILDAEGASTGNVIGGTNAGDRNTVSANKSGGVRVSGGGSTSNTTAGNNTGTTSSGVITIVPGNGGDAIRIDLGASQNVVGGTVGVTPGDCTGACNRIAYSDAAGVTVRDSTSVRNTIRGNVIAQNGALGIDLGADGVTPDDQQDEDHGPNDLQNFPVITSASFDGSSTHIRGTLNSTPNSSFQIELYANAAPDPSGFGEGRIFLGATPVGTNSLGNATFDVLIPGSYKFLTATATDALGNTSEFGKTFTNPGEAGQFRQSRGSGTSVDVSFAPACGATDHAIYWGVTPFVGGPNWVAVACGLGVSGSASYNPGVPPPGQAFYSVVVGQNGSVEGSYGATRPEASFASACNLPQELTVSCP